MSSPIHYNNCLYIHGLHSSVNSEKVGIMEKYFGKVTALHINYGETPDAYRILRSQCMNGKVDFIVGSSFGAYLGFFLSRELHLPSILFNPAFFFKDRDDTFVTGDIERSSPFSLIVIGEQDDVIPKGSIDRFLEKNARQDRIRIVRCGWLGHKIDLATFDSMLSVGVLLSREDAP